MFVRAFVAALLVASMTACATSDRAIPPTSSALQARHGAPGRLTIRIHIPRHKHHRRSSRYISASTKGMTIAFAGPTTLNKTIGLTPSSPGCQPGSNGTLCTVTLALAPCPTNANCYSGSLKTYDAVSCATTCTIPGSAKALSANQSVAFAIARSKNTNVGVTLDGIPVSVAIGARGPP